MQEKAPTDQLWPMGAKPEQRGTHSPLIQGHERGVDSHRGATPLSQVIYHQEVACGNINDPIIGLFITAGGERLNRPEFGCGLKVVVFEPNNHSAAAFIQYQVKQAVHHSNMYFSQSEKPPFSAPTSAWSCLLY
jgi:hypothetical protein